MNKITSAAIFSMLLSMSPANIMAQSSVNIRDSIFQASTNAGNYSSDKTEQGIDATNRAARVIARSMRDFIREQFISSSQFSNVLSEKAIEISEVSEPVFKVTKDGLAIVFEVTGKASDKSLEVTDKLMIILDPYFDKSTNITTDVTDRILLLLDKSSDVSTDITNKILEVLENSSEISTDVTQKVLELLGPASEVSTEVTEKIIEILAPYSKITGKTLYQLIEKNTSIISKAVYELIKHNTTITGEALSDLTERITLDITSSSVTLSDITEILLEVFEKPSQATSDVSKKILDALTRVTGEDNIIAGGNLSGDALVLSTEGVFAAFNFITGATTGLTNIFVAHREEIERAVERNDQEILGALRDFIRLEIEKTIEGGETLQKLLSDKDLDFYIRLRLAVGE